MAEYSGLGVFVAGLLGGLGRRFYGFPAWALRGSSLSLESPGGALGG